MMPVRLRWFSTLALAAFPAFAQDASYKGLHYVAPPGWTSGVREDQFVLAPADLTAETVLVLVLFGAERLGGKSFPDWFRGRMNSGLNGRVKVLRDSPVQPGTSGNLQTLSTGRTIQDGSGGVRLQIYYAISDGQQGAAAMLLASSQAAAEKYLPTIQGLFGSMRFSPTPPVVAGPATAPAPGPVAAQPGSGTFQNVRYTVPPGWSAQENAGGVALSPQSGLQGAETLDLVILPGRVGDNLEQVFQTTWAEVCAMLNAESMRNVSGNQYDLEGVARSTSGWDFLRGTGGARNSQRRFTISLFLARVPDRIERVAIISREIMVDLTTSNAALNPRFHGSIEEFLFSLRFANWTTPSFPEATLAGGPITGVWAGISMFGGELATGAAVFFSDGSAWFGGNFPTHGLGGLKPHIERNSDRRRWGNYQFQGGSGLLTMPYGKIPLRRDGDALILTTNNTPHRFIRSYPPATGRLNGRYCLGNGARCLTLTSDGRFRDEGAVRVVGHEVYPYPLSPERGEGEYEIRDYTLFLRYSGGPEIRVAFPGFLDQASAASPSPATITLSFNLDRLTRISQP